MTTHIPFTVSPDRVIQLDGPEFLAAVTMLTPVTIFASNHTIESYKTLADANIVNPPRGIKPQWLYLEIPTKHQHIADGFLGGGKVVSIEGQPYRPLDDVALQVFFERLFQKGYEDSERMATSMTELLSTAKDHGTKVVFYSRETEISKQMPQMQSTYLRMQEIWDESGRDAANDYLATLPEDEKADFKRFLSQQLVERDALNRVVADDIADKEGVIVSVGHWHVETRAQDDLDEMIGPERATTVVFFDSVDDPYFKDFYNKDLDLPDYFYFVKEQKAMVPAPQKIVHAKACEAGHALAGCGVEEVDAHEVYSNTAAILQNAVNQR